MGQKQTLNHAIMAIQRALTNNVKWLSLYYDYYKEVRGNAQKGEKRASTMNTYCVINYI